jgi:hypothetical protein
MSLMTTFDSMTPAQQQTMCEILNDARQSMRDQDTPTAMTATPPSLTKRARRRRLLQAKACRDFSYDASRSRGADDGWLLLMQNINEYERHLSSVYNR